MKLKIGAIGPRDSLDQIREVANQDERIELVEFEYSNFMQLADILNNHRYEVTQWIFSGQNPYYYSLDNNLITAEEAGFPPLHGISLLGTCMRVMQDKKVFINRMSLDTVDEKTVELVLKEFSINNLELELLSYKHYKPYDELIDFHTNLFEKGKTQVALTCLLTVYNELTERGIPCYRLVPSRLAIKTVLDLLVSRASSQVYEKLKVAIIGFECIDSFSVEESSYIYENRRKCLNLELELLQLAELLNGTLISYQNTKLSIYTTLGDLELLHSNQSFINLIKEIELKTSMTLNVGIGSGYTVYDAKKHVDIAFTHKQESNETSIIYVDEEKKIIDFLKEYTSYYTVGNLPSKWRDTLQEHSYTPIIPAKIYHYLKLKQIERFSSELVTSLLKNTDRNTRRILSDLEQMGLLEVVGEESSGKPGRPKKIYAIKP